MAAGNPMALIGVAKQNALTKLLRFYAAGMFFHRLIAPFFALTLFAVGARAATNSPQAYIIIDPQTGHVLEERESKQKRQVGSLTKVATAMVVLDWAEHRGGNLNQIVSIPPQALVGAPENNIGFQPGDVISLRDLLYAALVQSDNISAFTLAAHVGSTIQGITPPNSGGAKGGPIEAFVGQMNALARQLKMEKTHFVNPHGMDDKTVKPTPYSTAEDMARLAKYAMNKASFRFYVSQKERQIEFQSGGKKRAYRLRNTNDLVGTRGIDGVKTGRTARAGDCLILSAGRDPEVIQQGPYTKVNPRHLIIVLLGSTNRFGEGMGLLGRGWSLYDQWAAAGRLVDPQKVL